LGAALQYFVNQDKAAVEERVMNLRNFAYEQLKTLPALSIVSPPPGEAAAPMVTFRLRIEWTTRLSKPHCG
jgi:selenocysteine lyase/cysteine desulfurase